ncbi:Photosystem I chain L-like [Amphidinium carterae]
MAAGSTFRTTLAVCAAVAFAAVACPAFVPTGVPNASSLRGGRDGMGSTQQPHAGQSPVMGVAAVALVAGAAAGLMVAQSKVQRQAGRRELAVAYEDAGIDNGKFAQGLVGSEAAFGKYEFDPIGFSKYTELVPWFREAELKHGRIAMLAWVGLVVPDFVRIPGEAYSFEAVPRAIDAHDALNADAGPNFQIILFISIVELCCAKKVFEWNSVETAGDYNLTRLFPEDEEAQTRMRLAELKNGRLAMIAFGGAVTQAVITGKPFPWTF